MRRIILVLLGVLWLVTPAMAIEKLVMETSQGNIVLALDKQRAPVSVENFLAYVDKGFYDGTIFHRVIKEFMIQGGGYTADLQRKPTETPIRNEADNGLQNKRGTIALARTRNVDSATSQFFINVKDNGFLDHRDLSPQGFGYAVFGEVVEGMDVVDKIATTPTRRQNALFQDLPVETVIIQKVRRVSAN